MASAALQYESRLDADYPAVMRAVASLRVVNPKFTETNDPDPRVDVAPISNKARSRVVSHMQLMSEADVSRYNAWRQIASKYPHAKFSSLDVGDGDIRPSPTGRFSRSSKIYLKTLISDAVLGEMWKSVTVPSRLNGRVLPDGKVVVEDIVVGDDF